MRNELTGELKPARCNVWGRCWWCGGRRAGQVAWALAAFTLGLTFSNVNIMFNRSFQSLQRPWLPLYVGLVNLGLNAVLDWILLKPLGVAGITIESTEELRDLQRSVIDALAPLAAPEGGPDRRGRGA